MDWQIIINIGAGSFLAVGGWLARQLWDAVQDLKRDLNKLELHLAEHYLKKSDVEIFKAEIDKRFDRLEHMISKRFDNIENKVDRGVK